MVGISSISGGSIRVKLCIPEAGEGEGMETLCRGVKECHFYLGTKGSGGSKS